MLMKYKYLSHCIVLFIVVGCHINGYAQQNDSTAIKKGWNIGALPALGFDSNLGILYGGLINLFDYGSGENFPDYNHNIYFQLSAYTRGSMDAILNVDSYTLIPNKHFTGWLSYNRNRTYPFYGYNGKQTSYDEAIIDSDNSDFITQVFYAMDQQLIKANAMIQGQFGQSDFNWLLGIDLGYYNMSPVDIDHLNKRTSESDKIKQETTLYEHFIDWGIISNQEKDGGYDNSFKLGLVYDTRDRVTNPMKGAWTELLTRIAPEFAGNYNTFAKVAFIHRQYLTLVPERLSFAYRLWYEGALGDVPFYSRQYLTSSNHCVGVGGASTLRGVLMNRIVGKQTGLGNFEFRWKASRFRAIGQQFYLGFNVFTDAGYIIQAYDLDLSVVSQEEQMMYFNSNYQEWIGSAGAGLKLVMNENFVVSADYARSFDKNYGSSGLYIRIGYLF